MKNLFLAFCTFLLFQQLNFAQEVVSSTFLTSYELEYFTEDLQISFSQYGVDLYRVNYTTTNLEGALDTASGLVCIPKIDGFDLPLVSYGHGTVGSRFDVPSYLSGEHTLPALFSSMGTVCVAADYLGLGDNDGIHPYVHADSEAWASYDLLVAVNLFLAEEMDIHLNEQLFVTGYSQGGHAAMALHRMLEVEKGVEVNVAMPMSGPYSISTGMKDLLISEEEYGYVAYLASTAISYQEVYGTIFPNNDISQFFKQPYANIIQQYIDEEADLFDINQELIDALIENEGSASPKKMIFDDIVEAILADDDHPVNIALRDNDVYDWTPQADTRLIYCQADDQVAFENSIIARDKMIENGAQNVVALDINSEFNHTQCVTPAVTIFVLYLLVNATPTATSDIVEASFNVFPNPTQGGLRIVTEDINSTFSAEVMSMSGQTKMKKNGLRSGDFLDVVLEDGIYIILLKDSDGESMGMRKVVAF